MTFGMDSQKQVSARGAAVRRTTSEAWLKERAETIKARKAIRLERERGFMVSGDEYRAIVDRFADPTAGRESKASQLNGLIHNPDASSMLVRQWIEENVVDQIRDKGNTLTAAFLVNVCKRCSIERILHERYGFGVDLIRAATLFERERARLVKAGTPCPLNEERDLWDEMVRRDVDRQLAEYEAGRRKSPPRYMPLADGTTSNPNPGCAGRRKACGGYDEWKAFVDRFDPEAAYQSRYATLDEEEREWTPSDGIDHTATPVINADWLASHHATAMAALGLDSPDASPRLKRLYLILGDITLARTVDRIADPGVRSRDILRRLGLSDREARTGLRYELILRRHPNADRLKAWNHACAHSGVHHASPGRAMLRRYLGHVADAVNHAESLVRA